MEGIHQFVLVDFAMRDPCSSAESFLHTQNFTSVLMRERKSGAKCMEHRSVKDAERMFLSQEGTRKDSAADLVIQGLKIQDSVILPRR